MRTFETEAIDVRK